MKNTNLLDKQNAQVSMLNLVVPEEVTGLCVLNSSILCFTK